MKAFVGQFARHGAGNRRQPKAVTQRHRCNYETTDPNLHRMVIAGAQVVQLGKTHQKYPQSIYQNVGKIRKAPKDKSKQLPTILYQYVSESTIQSTISQLYNFVESDEIDPIAIVLQFGRGYKQLKVQVKGFSSHVMQKRRSAGGFICLINNTSPAALLDQVPIVVDAHTKTTLPSTEYFTWLHIPQAAQPHQPADLYLCVLQLPRSFRQVSGYSASGTAVLATLESHVRKLRKRGHVVIVGDPSAPLGSLQAGDADSERETDGDVSIHDSIVTTRCSQDARPPTARTRALLSLCHRTGLVVVNGVAAAGDVAGRATRLNDGGVVGDMVAVDRELLEAGVNLQVVQRLGQHKGTFPVVLQFGGNAKVDKGEADKFSCVEWKGASVEEQVHVALRMAKQEQHNIHQLNKGRGKKWSPYIESMVERTLQSERFSPDLTERMLHRLKPLSRRWLWDENGFRVQMKALRTFSSRTGYDIHDALERFPALVLVEGGTLRERYRYLKTHLTPLTGTEDFENAVNYYPKLLMKMPFRILQNIMDIDEVYKAHLAQAMPWAVLHDERCAMLWLLPKRFIEVRVKAMVKAFGQDNAARLVGLQPLVLLPRAENAQVVAGWQKEHGIVVGAAWGMDQVDLVVKAYAQFRPLVDIW